MRLRYRRMRLKRDDGKIFLDRWGIQVERSEKPDPVCGIFLHLMRAPDPGLDLHDHPWTFITLPLWGSYLEQRSNIRDAPQLAREAEETIVTWNVDPNAVARGRVEHVVRWRPRMMRLDESHRIFDLLNHRFVVTIVLHGPTRRKWGFYTELGFDDQTTYESTRARPLANDMEFER